VVATAIETGEDLLRCIVYVFNGLPSAVFVNIFKAVHRSFDVEPLVTGCAERASPACTGCKEIEMAIQIPEHLDIEPVGCHWDPDDPFACFDDTSCGCYMNPCDYFGIEAKDCAMDTCEPCCTLVYTC